MPQLLIFLLEILTLYFLSKALIRKFQRNIFRIFPNKKFSTYIFALLFLPGTLLHELSHWIVAELLQVKTGKFTVIPNFQELEDNKHQIILGSVQIQKTGPVRRLIVGAAPFYLGTTLLLLLIYWATSNNLFANNKIAILLIYIIFQIANTMFSSSRDMEGAWKVGIVLAAIYLGMYFIGIRISLDQGSQLSGNFTEVLRQANKYLLWPIGIDLGLLLIFRSLRSIKKK